MCHLEYMGLRWDVPSPSFWKLSPEYSKDDNIDVSYLGDVWILSHKRADGTCRADTYDNRDAALSVVVQAFKNSGAI